MSTPPRGANLLRRHSGGNGEGSRRDRSRAIRWCNAIWFSQSCTRTRAPLVVQRREIKHAEADFKKAPYLGVCRQTSQKMANLVGIKINSGFTERIIESVGGKDGCHHLVDQTLEMAKSMAQFIDNSCNFPIREYIEDAA